MPKISPEAKEENVNQLATHAQQTLSVIPASVVITGVGRKINTGNYENVDIYAGVTIPISLLPTDPNDLEAFKDAVAAACELGFAMASKETGARYNLIKEMQSGGRQTEAPTQ